MDLLKMTQNRMERLNFVNKGISKLGIVVRPMRKKINFFLTFTKRRKISRRKIFLADKPYVLPTIWDLILKLLDLLRKCLSVKIMM